MSSWNLIEHGDVYEKRGWPNFGLRFPNYEEFWRQFIVPMSCRECTPPGQPLWIHFRKDVDPDAQRIAMAHYSIFRALAYINEIITIQNDSEFHQNFSFTYSERIDNVYIYLANIIDLVALLFWSVHKLESRFSIPVGKFPEKYNLQRILEKAEYYFSSGHYQDDFKQFCNKKRVASIKLHEPDDVTSFIKDAVLKKDWREFSRDIRTYRNAVIHNTMIGHLIDVDNEELIPLKDKLRDYELWGTIIYYPQQDHFEPSEDAIKRDFFRMCDLLNRLWHHLIESYTVVSSKADYAACLGSAPSPLSLFFQPSSSAKRVTGSSGDGLLR